MDRRTQICQKEKTGLGDTDEKPLPNYIYGLFVINRRWRDFTGNLGYPGSNCAD